MIRKFIPGLLLLVLFLYCNKNPLGEEELSSRGISSPSFMTVVIDSLETCYTAPGQGKSLNVILGRNHEYESRILLKFLFPDTISASAQDIRLVLYKRQHMQADPIEFNLHLVTTIWGEENVSWSLADQGVKWYKEGGDYETSPMLSKTATGDSVIIRFTLSQLEQIKISEGVILIPIQDGFTVFYSQEGGKPARLTYKIDNQQYNIPLNGDAHIVNDSLPEPFNKIWLGAGIPFRAFMYLPSDTAIFNKKIIYGQLRMNKIFATSLRETMDIVIRSLTEPYKGFDTKFGSLLGSENVALDDSICEIDVINILQRIADKPDSNFGFFVMTNPENYDISRYEIDPTSISLEIGYIRPPQTR